MSEELVRGDKSVNDPCMTLDVVAWHGEWWSLNNRHLKALKLYLREIHPEWKRADRKARVRIWRLQGGRTVTEKFASALDTMDRDRRCQCWRRDFVNNRRDHGNNPYRGYDWTSRCALRCFCAEWPRYGDSDVYMPGGWGRIGPPSAHGVGWC